MDKYYCYYFSMFSAFTILLSILVATGESMMHSGKGKAAASTSSSDTTRTQNMVRECFADLFVSHFGAVPEMSGLQFVVEESDFPDRQDISGLMLSEDTEESRKKKQTFIDCLKKKSPFPNHLHELNHVDNLVQEFYRHKVLEISVSPEMQRKMHNAQCWLDLGAIEGKIKMQRIRPIGKSHHNSRSTSETKPWLVELELESDEKPIMVGLEGAVHIVNCLQKETPFEAKLKEKVTITTTTGQKHQWHLHLLKATERTDLLEIIEQTPFSEWLCNKISNEQMCVADLLVRRWHAKTRLHRFYTNYSNTNFPPELWRRIVWSDYMQQNGRPTQIYDNENADEEFEKLKNCLFRKAAFLKFDTILEKQYIDLEPFFRLLGDGIYTSPLLTQELNTQSECLAKFLAIKSGDNGKCLLITKKGPTGDLLYDRNPDWSRFINAPFRANIINFGSEHAYALSAEKCHLPEEMPGVYQAGSKEFRMLEDCGVLMTTKATTEHQQGRKEKITNIDVRMLLQIHTPEQLYMRVHDECPTCEAMFMNAHQRDATESEEETDDE